MASFDAMNSEDDPVFKGASYNFPADAPPLASAENVDPSGGEGMPEHSADVYGFGTPNPEFSSPFEEGNGHGNGKPYEENDSVFLSDGPALPPPAEMLPEEGAAFREWRRDYMFERIGKSASKQQNWLKFLIFS